MVLDELRNFKTTVVKFKVLFIFASALSEKRINNQGRAPYKLM
jgi:hypothetical protein